MEAAQLDVMTLDELRHLAAARGIPGAALLGRPDLIRALQESAGPGAGSEANAHHLRAGGTPTSVLPARPTEYDSEMMARVYLEQGLAERAVEIYRQLVAARPGDAALMARLADAERAAADERSRRPPRPEASRPAPTPLGGSPDEPYGMLDFEELPEAYGIDEVEVLFRIPHSVFAYWEVTEAGMQAARTQLGDEGTDAKLVLRLFSTGATAADVAPGTRDYPIEGWRGRRYLLSLKPGARLRAAIGLVSPSGLFSPVAHSSVVRVPPAEPAPYDPRALEWIEVRPSLSAYRGERPEPISILRKVAASQAPRVLATDRSGYPVEGAPGEAGTEGAVGGPSSPGGASSPEGRPSSPPSPSSLTSPSSPGRWNPGSN